LYKDQVCIECGQSVEFHKMGCESRLTPSDLRSNDKGDMRDDKYIKGPKLKCSICNKETKDLWVSSPTHRRCTDCIMKLCKERCDKRSD
jgi:hypothetical protein